MSTTYRVLVTCDEQKSPQCVGFLEHSAPHPRGISSTHQRAEERGWLRAYGAMDTYDVCPACRPLVAPAAAAVDDAPIVLTGEQVAKLGGEPIVAPEGNASE